MSCNFLIRVFCCTTVSSKLTHAVLPPKLTSALCTPAVSSSVSLMSAAQESPRIPSICSSAFTSLLPPCTFIVLPRLPLIIAQNCADGPTRLGPRGSHYFEIGRASCRERV